MVPATLSFMASSRPFLAPAARPENFPLLYRSLSFPKQVHNVGRGFLASPPPYPGRPRFAASFVVTSSIPENENSGQQTRRFQSSNSSTWKNEPLPGNLSQRTSRPVPKADDGGKGSDSEDSSCNRRLVIVSYDKMEWKTPYPRKDVIEKLQHEKWLPQYCFVRNSTRPKEIWKNMKNSPSVNDGKGPYEETQEILPNDDNPCSLSKQKFETTFEKYLSDSNSKIETIMVMTIGKKDDFQVLVEDLAGRNFGFDGLPYVALLERKYRGESWSKDTKSIKCHVYARYGGTSPNPVSGERGDQKSSTNPVSGERVDQKSSANPVSGETADQKSSANPVSGETADQKSSPNPVLGERVDQKSSRNPVWSKRVDQKSSPNPVWSRRVDQKPSPNSVWSKRVDQKANDTEAPKFNKSRDK